VHPCRAVWHFDRREIAQSPFPNLRALRPDRSRLAFSAAARNRDAEGTITDDSKKKKKRKKKKERKKKGKEEKKGMTDRGGEDPARACAGETRAPKEIHRAGAPVFSAT